MKKFWLCYVAVLLCSFDVFAQGAIEPPLITVSGQAEVRVPPDEVVFTLGVESVDKDISAAKTKTDTGVKEVFAIARRNNIKAEDVQTSNISIQPRYNTDEVDYDQRRNMKREFLGYQASKAIAVILHDITRFDSLLSEVLKAGVTHLSNLEFRDSEIRKHRDQARRMAMKAAQEKARLMANEIGQAIGEAYSITETEGDSLGRNATQNVSSFSLPESPDRDSAIAPGLISVTAKVTVRFRLQ